MKLRLLRRPVALLLAVAMLVALVYIPAGGLKAFAQADSVQELLGDNWYVYWNSGAAEEACVTVVSGGAVGDYALRIGHATEQTNICLRYKLYKTDMGLTTTDETGIGMKFSAKVEGGFADGSWIGIINPVANPGGGNRSNLTDGDMAAIGTSWTVFDKGTDFGVWCGGEHDRAELEFNIVLDAGNYFYLDDLQGFGYWGDISPDMAFVNVVKNGSFEEGNQENTQTTTAPAELDAVQEKLGENWYVFWNSGTAASEEYLNVVQGGSHGDYSLRIGHPTVKTDLCLRYRVYKSEMGMIAGQETGVGMKFSAKLEGSLADGTWIGVINPVDPATGGNRSNLSATDLASIGAEWTLIDKSDEYYGVWCGPEHDRAELEFNIVLDAGNYFYLDDLQGYGYWGDISNDMAFVNVVKNSSFEDGNQQIPPPQPVADTLVAGHKRADGWYVSWNEQNQYRSDYLTTQSYSGNYALALTALESNMGHTIATQIEGLEEGATYILEGQFKKKGDFSSISIMYGSTFLQLKNQQLDSWTLCSGSFTAGSGKTLSIYTVCPQGGQLLVDDLKLYKADDASKTNLLTNGDFEITAGSASDKLKLDKAFATMPVSVEAKLRIGANAKGGVILGNYNGKHGYNVGINAQGQPYVYAVLTDGTVTEAIFDSVDVRTGEAITLNISNAGGKLTCQVNGEVKQTLDIAVSADEQLYAEAFAIGGDQTDKNENYFAADLLALSVSGENGLLAAWEPEKTANPMGIADSTGNGYPALYYGPYFDALTADTLEKYPYAFVAVGDTQYTNRGDTQTGNDYMGALYQWIIDNQQKYNIQAVLGMGDIVDTSPNTNDESAKTQSLKEWAHAVESIGKLNAAGIPYTLVKGNHDSIPEYPENDTAVFEDSLKALGYDSRVQGWYEEGGSLANAYITLTVGQTQWLILTLDYNYSAEEIAWADSVIAAHPDHKVIVTTHAYLDATGQWLDSSDRCQLMTEDLWDMLIGKHENIELVLSGHVSSTDVKVQQFRGAGDNIVTEMLIDSQSDDRDEYLAAGRAPYAMATLLLFSRDGDEVKVANYATGKGKFIHADAMHTVDLSDGQEILPPNAIPPMEVALEDVEIPVWITRWNGNEDVNYRYLTTYAHSGEYALALTGTEAAMSYTYGQLLRRLEVGEEYTLEGYVFTSGKFKMLDLMVGGNSNKQSLKNLPKEQWNKVTMTFVPGESTMALELFADAKAKSVVLLDDVTVYKTGDPEKTNLVENPGFEMIETPQTNAPEKVFDYPLDWELWAENDDGSQLFVTDTAYEGKQAVAFVNTSKHASSLTQKVTGLAEGEYVLSAYIRSSGGQDDAAMLIKGYDKENPNGQAGAKITKHGIWTRIELEFTVTSGQVQIALWNAGNKDNWFIVDQIELVKKDDTTYTNLLTNGGFEHAKNEVSAQNPMQVELIDWEISGWTTRWNGNEGTNYRYLTTHAHSGQYALALTGTEDAMGYTYGQVLHGLAVGQEYTIEGYVLYSGKFIMLDLMMGGNANKLSLKNFPQEQWNKVTMTFVAQESTMALELFGDGPAKSIVLLDDVTVYQSADPEKKNLVENPGFESMETAQTKAPEKTFDYPSDWELWAENDDASQIFVTDTAYDGKLAAAFVNTSKHASSLTQNISGLENGMYVLSAYVRSSGGQEDAALLAKGYDKENPAGQSGAKIHKCGIWTRVELEFEVTSGQVQVSLWNAGNEGCWMVIDKVELVNKADATNTNLLTNGSFEQAENELPPQQPIAVKLISRDIPGWVEAWSENPGATYRYLTTHSNSGKYALALTSKKGNIGYTFAQRLDLQKGVSYTLEGYIYKSGEMNAADILIGANGADGKLSFADSRMEGYEKFAIVFRSSTDYLEIGAFASGPEGSLLMLDDLLLYKTQDARKKNLLRNGDFESLEAMQTKPPVATEELPQGWDIWTDDNNLTTVFLTEAGRNGGYAMGMHSAQKQAASLTQTVTGLEKGTYVLTAWVKSSGGQKDAAMLMKGFDKASPSSQIGAKIYKSGVWMQIRLEAEISSGQVLISFWNDANAGNWLMIDEVCLYRKGDPAKTNLLTNGSFAEVLQAASGELPPAGEYEDTQPPVASEPQDEEIPQTPESPKPTNWIVYGIGGILVLAILAGAAVLVVKKTKK